MGCRRVVQTPVGIVLLFKVLVDTFLHQLWGAKVRFLPLFCLTIALLTSTAHAGDVPANAHLGFGGKYWVCDRGYHKQDNGCVTLRIPENATLDYTGNSWTCLRGFKRQGQVCVPIPVPNNAKLDYTGHWWTCDRGYRQQGNACVVVAVPENASLDYTGHYWTCNRGYRLVGQSCEHINLPRNAELDYTGHAWKCVRGFRNNNGVCQSFHVPENAQIDITGNNFSCLLHYKRVGDHCESMTDKEIQYQNYLIALAMQCGDTKSVDVDGTCGGENVRGEIDICQKSKEASGKLEFDNGLATEFSGEWTSADEVEGTDGFGNSCDLEIN